MVYSSEDFERHDLTITLHDRENSSHAGPSGRPTLIDRTRELEIFEDVKKKMKAGGFAKYYNNYYLVHNLCMFAGKTESTCQLLCTYTSTDAIIMVMKEGRETITEEDLVKAESKKDARAIGRQMVAATAKVEDIELRWRYERLLRREA